MLQLIFILSTLVGFECTLHMCCGPQSSQAVMVVVTMICVHHWFSFLALQLPVTVRTCRLSVPGVCLV